MIYVINKIVGWVTSPLGLALLLLIVSFALLWLQRRRLAWWAVAIACAWLWIWSMPVTGRFVGAPLERGYLVDGRVPTPEHLPTAEVIVILGGGMTSATNICNYGEMCPASDRVWMGARLWKAHRAPRIVATGEGSRESTAQLLADFAIPTNAVSFCLEPRNTEEEARALVSEGVRKILLVTSAWHMDRARLLFAKYAPELEVIPAATDFENLLGEGEPLKLTDFFPSAQALAGNSSAFREYVALVGYRLLR